MKKENNELVHSERIRKIIEQFKTRNIDGQKVSDLKFSEYFIMTQLEHLTIQELDSFQIFLNQEEKRRKIRRVKSDSESTNSVIATKPEST
jgi:hypothetical protein